MYSVLCHLPVSIYQCLNRNFKVFVCVNNDQFIYSVHSVVCLPRSCVGETVKTCRNLKDAFNKSTVFNHTHITFQSVP